MSRVDLHRWLKDAARADAWRPGVLYVCARVYADVPYDELSAKERETYDALKGATHLHYTDAEVEGLELVGRRVYLTHDVTPQTAAVGTILTRHHVGRDVYATVRVEDAATAHAIDRDGALASFSLREWTRHEIDPHRREVVRDKLALDAAVLPRGAQCRPRCHALACLSTFCDDPDIYEPRAFRHEATTTPQHRSVSDSSMATPEELKELKTATEKYLAEQTRLEAELKNRDEKLAAYETADQEAKKAEFTRTQNMRAHLAKLMTDLDASATDKGDDDGGDGNETGGGGKLLQAADTLLAHVNPCGEEAQQPSQREMMEATRTVLGFACQSLGGGGTRKRTRDEAGLRDDALAARMTSSRRSMLPFGRDEIQTQRAQAEKNLVRLEQLIGGT